MEKLWTSRIANFAAYSSRSQFLAEVAYASETCPAPPFRSSKILADASSEISLHISISLQDFAPARLICLAADVKQRYSGRNIWAAILSSHEAAVAYSPVTVEENPIFRAAQARLHAFYTYDRATGEDELQILPDGLHRRAGSSMTTRIDLPANRTISCKVELDSRCLLEFHPYAGESDPVSGIVTLSGSVGQNGVLSSTALVDVKVSPLDRQSMLVDWAGDSKLLNTTLLRNLRGSLASAARNACEFPASVGRDRSAWAEEIGTGWGPAGSRCSGTAKFLYLPASCTVSSSRNRLPWRQGHRPVALAACKFCRTTSGVRRGRQR